MRPKLFKSFAAKMLDGRVDVRELYCQAYLGFRDGSVHLDTRREIGRMITEIRDDGFMFDWPKNEVQWAVDKDCEIVVILSGVMPVAYFEPMGGDLFKDDTVEVIFHGGLGKDKDKEGFAFGPLFRRIFGKPPEQTNDI